MDVPVGQRRCLGDNLEEQLQRTISPIIHLQSTDNQPTITKTSHWPTRLMDCLGGLSYGLSVDILMDDPMKCPGGMSVDIFGARNFGHFHKEITEFFYKMVDSATGC